MKIAFIFLAAVLSLSDLSAQKMTEFTERTFTAPDGRTLPYRLLLPENYDPAKSYPVVLFLHGAGERGSDNQIHLKNGIENFLQPKLRADFPCFVIAPQCPANQQWVNMPWNADSGVRPAEVSEPLGLALQILDGVEKEFNIDRDREYVAGISMGGYGTWDCVTRFPNRFAAAIPVCGGGDENTIIAEVARLPIWALHSADDGVVKVHRSQKMIKAVIAAGGKPHYTEYPAEGHGSWTRAFKEKELFPWLFSQKRGQADSFSITVQN